MIAVGLDMAKAKFDAVIWQEKPAGNKGKASKKVKHKLFENTDAGFTLLASWLAHHAKAELHLCMEATNSYGFALAYFMTAQGYQVSIVNPSQIKAFADSDLKRNKTDKLDAATIAAFCYKKAPRLWQPASEKAQQFQALYRRWETLKDIAAREKNRLDSDRNEQVRSSLESHLAYWEEQAEAVERALDTHVRYTRSK